MVTESILKQFLEGHYLDERYMPVRTRFSSPYAMYKCRIDP
jgi:hypothetical protein